MKKLTLAFIILTGIIFSVDAKSWRVNNTPGIDADFTTLTAAQDSASAGDTLYIEGSATSYGNFNINKKLIIIGPGYFLTENDSSQALKQTAILGQVQIYADGTVLSGIYATGYVLNRASNVVITRNYVTESNNGISVAHDVSNIHDVVVSQNYCVRISRNRDVRDVLIFNNIVESYILMGTASDNFTGVIKNNVVGYYIEAVHAEIKNNIIYYSSNPYNGSYIGYKVLAGSTYHYNLFAGTTVLTGIGNVANVDMNDVFTDFTNKNVDNDFMLKEGSPALAAGENGSDCGAFGGDQPYVLSGIPGVPHIYEAIIPTSASGDSGLKVFLKIKTNN
ncbi:hypothetical protein [Maribellus sediminis]|uniref:hypothetical protein n=1 Tax=Maribellus sediminis TaxID=2696285 RepID=UPI00142FDD92|nr:hypothetical protein [Maribellus sediminis]